MLIRALFLIVLFCLPAMGFTSEGFLPSHDPNVLMIKGKTDGATAFVLKVDGIGPVLVSQVHVVEGLKKPLHIQWGYEVGWFYQLQSPSAGSFIFPLEPEILWKDDKLDVVVMKLPAELQKYCTGFESEAFQEGHASLIGYPELARRTYPRTSKRWIDLQVLLGHVQQMTSVGNVWVNNGEFLGDIDALSGNSGGPVLSANGKVIGVIHLLKTWQGVGYRYQLPSLEIAPIDLVLENLKALSPRVSQERF